MAIVNAWLLVINQRDNDTAESSFLFQWTVIAEFVLLSEAEIWCTQVNKHYS